MFQALLRVYQTSTFIPKPRSEVFAFFCDAKNLERITPPTLQFHILEQTTKNITQGTEFEYQLKIHGVPVRWRSKIIDWKPEEKFTDIQIKGPYKKWHHTHTFEEVESGTLMTDTVLYQLRGGRLIDLLAGWWVKKDVAKIFSYREQVIQNYF
ncbi:MAG: SRPBCC family protein [Bdellovibrionales bacterium]|nr:SRPBCC family protein [Bdellovibrionales bacterium]